MSHPPISLANASSNTIETVQGVEEVVHDEQKKLPRDPATGTQPFSAGFFDNSPAASGARKGYAKRVVLGALTTSVAIWCVLTIYWGALWKTFDLVHHLKGCVVVCSYAFPRPCQADYVYDLKDFDGGEIGSTVTQALGAINAKDQLTWRVQPASMYPGGPSDLAEAVVEERCWFGIASMCNLRHYFLVANMTTYSQLRGHGKPHSGNHHCRREL